MSDGWDIVAEYADTVAAQVEIIQKKDAEIERLTRERDTYANDYQRIFEDNERLTRENADCEQEQKEAGEAIMQAERMIVKEIATSERLRAALKRHGAHDGNCDALTLLTSNPPLRRPCNCGLAAALAPDSAA
jgi:FtsZ-binding cell division protein ZapB